MLRRRTRPRTSSASSPVIFTDGARHRCTRASPKRSCWRSVWEPVDLSTDADALDPKPPDPNMGGLVYPASRCLLSSPTEGTKTLTSYALALQKIRSGGRVAVIDFEM